MWGVIIPQYTQCTSVGDLVNRKHLIELDAIAKLEEKKNLRQEEIDRIMIEKEISENMTNRTKSTKSTKSSLLRQQTSIDESLEMISNLVKTPVVKKKRVSYESDPSFTATKSNASHKHYNASIPSKSTGLKKQQSLPVGLEIVTTSFPRVRSNSELSGSEGRRITTLSDNQNIVDDQPIFEINHFETILRDAFVTKTYRQVSGVCGTMLLMYFLSLRLQMLLINTCKIIDLNNIWYFWLTFPDVFWIVITFFGIFLLESSIIIILFLREKDKQHFYMIIAGVMDILLTSLCIAIFLGAEFIRCSICDSVNEVNSLYDNNITYIEENRLTCPNIEIYTKNPSFGSCLCGGGMEVLELFTFIIAFRMMRFYIAYRLTDTSKNEEVKIQDITDSFRHKHHNEEYSMIKGTAAQLWILALQKYSDVVQQHGIFSRNLLESMLGIESFPDGCTKQGSDTEKVSFTFERPFAKLVRSMRRCHCKWYPFLSDEWRLVDVVMTEHELVWFDVNVDIEKLSPMEIAKLESLRHRISKERKNIVLSDVAYGRIILGLVSLTDLEHIKVERRLPKVTSSDEMPIERKTADNDTENMRQLSMLGSEYWSSSTYCTDENMSRWNKVERNWLDNYTIQDKLKLNTIHGSLSLWFVEDINEAIRSGGHVVGDEIKKDYESEAYLWCKEIVDIVGNVKQNHRITQDLIKVEGQEVGGAEKEEGSVQQFFGRFSFLNK